MVRHFENNLKMNTYFIALKTKICKVRFESLLWLMKKKWTFENYPVSFGFFECPGQLGNLI